MWKGYVYNDNVNAMSRASTPGYFSPSEVELNVRSQGVKPFHSIQFPAATAAAGIRHYGNNSCQPTSSSSSSHDQSPFVVTVGVDQSFPHPPSPLSKPKSFSSDSSGDSGIDLRLFLSPSSHSIASSSSSSTQQTNCSLVGQNTKRVALPPPVKTSCTATKGVDRTAEWLHHHGPPDVPGLTSGGHRSASPMFNKDSPTGSNRSSTASSNSSGSSSSGYLGSSGHVNSGNGGPAGGLSSGGGLGHNTPSSLRQHRLSGQSSESGVSSIASSSSRYSCVGTSSWGTGHDILEDSSPAPQPPPAQTDGASSNSACSAYGNDVYQQERKEAEILYSWLADLRLLDCYQLFLEAGYDMPTISRMTPEDLTAIGITQPALRKRLTSEISKLNISDGIPNYKPNTVLEWLQLLRLEQYYEALVRDGYDSLRQIIDIAWEDLEEIGFRKLGHQKKIILAIDRLKKLSCSDRRVSAFDQPESPSFGADTAPIPGPSNRRAVHPCPASAPVSMRLLRWSDSGENLDQSNRCHGGADEREGGNHRLPEIIHPALPTRRPVSAQPEVIAIQVKRVALPGRLNEVTAVNDGNAHSTPPITYESFHGNPEKDFYCLLGHDNVPATTDGDTTPTNETGSLSADEAEGTVTPSQLTRIRPRIAPKPDVRGRHSSGDSIRDMAVGTISGVGRGGSLTRRASCRSHERGSNAVADCVDSAGHAVNTSLQPCPLLSGGCCNSAPVTPAHSVSSPTGHGGYRSIPPQSPTSQVHHSLTGHMTAVTNLNKPGSPSPGNNQNQARKTLPPPSSPIQSNRIKKAPPPPPPKRTNSVRENRKSETECEEQNSSWDGASAMALLSSNVDNSQDCLSSEAENALDQVIERLQWRGDQTIKPNKCKGSNKPPPPRSPSALNSRNIGGTLVARQTSGGSDKLSRSDSNCSSCSTDSNTLPFANENIGTIKQKATGASGSLPVTINKPSAISTGDEAQKGGTPVKKLFRPVRAPKPQISKVSPSTTQQTDSSPSSPSHNGNTDDVFNDIDDMFHGLTQELDDMLTFQGP